MMAAAHAAAAICRPFRAPGFCATSTNLGLTPQAMNLSRLRRSLICPTLVAPARNGPPGFSFPGSSRPWILKCFSTYLTNVFDAAVFAVVVLDLDVTVRVDSQRGRHVEAALAAAEGIGLELGDPEGVVK